MSNTAASLRRKIVSAGELESVVRTMKAMAASSIGQYENAVRSLDDYYRTVQLGLVTCFRQSERARTGPQEAGAIVFGSDQGLVGQFNDVMAEFVVDALEKLPGKKLSGPSANASGCALRTLTCSRENNSSCRTRPAQSRRWSGRFCS